MRELPQRFPPDDPREWLNRACSDLNLARSRIPDVLLDDLCFHAQQAAEKAIKAVLIQRNVEFPYVHDLAQLLAEEPEDFELLVAGHTDALGADSYNQQLSERRARTASNYLIRRGVDPSRLRTVGMGESEPVASNDTVEGQQENRRVEVAIFASEAYREEMVRRHGNGR